jgi:hypothetical protein
VIDSQQKFIAVLNVFDEEASAREALGASLVATHDEIFVGLLDALVAMGLESETAVGWFGIDEQSSFEPYSPDQLEMSLSAFRAGSARSVTIGLTQGNWTRDFGGRSMPSFQARVEIGDKQLSILEPAHTIRLSVDRDIRRDWDEQRWERAIRDWIITQTTAVSASYGYLTFDYDPPTGQSPYEMWVGLPIAETICHVGTRVRGYYWGNLLTEGHIAQLGGVDRVIKHAPVAIVETIDISGRTGLYLQLTEHAAEVRDDALAELRRFLSPLLMVGRPGWRSPKTPLRVVEPRFP